MGVNIYQDYCTGCGLCIQECKAGVLMKKGFLIPELKMEDSEFCKKICPVAGSNASAEGNWGRYRAIYTGFAADRGIRKKASSGGVITALCMFLLKSELVDGIIHTGKDREKPWRTCTVCSTTQDEVISHAGSRYTQSMTFVNIQSLMQDGKKYAVVGKPCDIVALKNYMEIHSEIREKVYCTISFFCAGQPSEKANIRLIEAMGCSLEKCKDLQYRGNGWPGSATAIDNMGNAFRMSYADSWGGILGRDIRKACRFCMNGTGEPADISCGDAWILGTDGKPDFSERDGINVILARSEVGEHLLDAACAADAIKLCSNRNIINELPIIQRYQYERKATMVSKVLAMKLMLRKTPAYRMITLFNIGKQSDVTLKRQFKIFAGSLKRILQHKM